MSGDDDLDRAMRRVATHGLTPAPLGDDIDWGDLGASRLWERAGADRLAGLLIAELQAERALGRVPENLVEDVEPLARRRAILLTALEWELVALTAQLESAGIGVCAVKGAAVARSLYPRHWWRDFGDLDILVDRADFGAAVDVLGANGIRPIVAPPTRRAMTLMGKGVTLRHPLGHEIDLHHTLLAGSFGFGRSWDFWMRSAIHVDIGGHQIATTGPVETTLHLLGHLCLGGSRNPSAHILRDVVQALESIDPNSSQAEALFDAVDRTGLDGLVQAALSRLDSGLGWQHEGWAEWGRQHPPQPGWAAIEGLHAREIESFRAVVTESLRLNRRPGDRVAIVRAALWPSSAHLSGRGLTRSDHIARLVGLRRH